MYGVITQQSIGTLFIAGIVPGIMLALLFMLTIYISGRIKPSLCPKGPRTKLKEKFYAFGQCGEIIVLIFLVLGGLLIGWFTPTEAGAVGVFGAIAISMARKRLKWRSFTDALKRAAKTIGMIYIILIGAFILNYFMTVSTIPDRLASLVSALPLPPLAIIAVVVLIYMFLGCFLDAAAMVLLTVPIFFPMIVSLGFDPIWFGILVVLTCEMAMITPPIGMNVYAINGIAPDVTMSGIFKGVIPFFLMLFLFTIFIVLVPQVVLFLPNNL